MSANRSVLGTLSNSSANARAGSSRFSAGGPAVRASTGPAESSYPTKRNTLSIGTSGRPSIDPRKSSLSR